VFMDMITPLFRSWSGEFEREKLPALTEGELASRQDAYREFGKTLFEKGYLSTDSNFPRLPAEVARDIIDVVWFMNPVRRIWAFRKLATNEMKIKIKTGKIVVSAPSEGVAPSETKPTWGSDVALTARELRAWTDVSDIAVEDAVIDIVADLVKDFGAAIAETEARNFLSGDGSASNVYNVFTGLGKASGAPSTDKAGNGLTVSDVLNAVSYFEETLGSVPRLYLFGHPQALKHLRSDLLTNYKLPGYAERVLAGYEIEEILGVRDVISTPLIPVSGTPKVSDVVLCFPERAAVAGDRRSLTIERGIKDVKSGLTTYAVSERVAWAIADPNATYVFKNCLSQ